MGDLIIFQSFDITYLVYHRVTYIITKNGLSYVSPLLQTNDTAL